MTIIAWDGHTLAVDRAAERCGMIYEVDKYIKPEHGATGTVLTWCGNHGQGLMLAKWYLQGRIEKEWPKFQEDKDSWTDLIVASFHGIACYERQPIAIKIIAPFMAWGSGRDYAMAAMHMGADARKAVEVASLFDTGCGKGCDAFDLRS